MNFVTFAPAVYCIPLMVDWLSDFQREKVPKKLTFGQMYCIGQVY